jgi:hypothetical protein
LYVRSISKTSHHCSGQVSWTRPHSYIHSAIENELDRCKEIAVFGLVYCF